MTDPDPFQVLVVDDDFSVAKTLSRQLTLYGKRPGSRPYSVAIARDSKGALEAMEETPPHAVVLDYDFAGTSGENGADILHKIRKVDRFVPVIVHTGRMQAADEQRVVREGVNFISRKAHAPDLLPGVIERAIRTENEIVQAFELWLEGNSSADQPLFEREGRMYTARQALDEMRQATAMGRELIDMYREEAFGFLARKARRKAGDR